MGRRALGLWVVLAVLPAAVASSGCDDNLPKATEITHMRMLGHRAEVVGEPQRATPRPGESVDVRYQMVFPEVEQDTEELRSMFLACTYPNRFTGIPFCQELIDLVEMMAGDGFNLDFLDIPTRVTCDNDAVPFSMIGIQCVDGPPELQVEVEADFDAPAKLVRGVICEDGVPFVDIESPQLFGCQDNDGEEILVHGAVPVARDEDQENQNPDISQVTFRMDRSVWEPTDRPLSEIDCGARDPGVRVIDPFEHTIGIELDADDREELEDGFEDLEFSAYATAGELERRFTVFNGDDEAEGGQFENSLTWELFERDDIGSGVMVRFFFTLLDRRGGLDMTTRVACVK